MNSTGGIHEIASSGGASAAASRSILKQRLLANNAGLSSSLSSSMRGITPNLQAGSASFAVAPQENRFRLSKSTMKSHAGAHHRGDIAVSRASGGRLIVSKKKGAASQGTALEQLAQMETSHYDIEPDNSDLKIDDEGTPAKGRRNKSPQGSNKKRQAKQRRVAKNSPQAPQLKPPQQRQQRRYQSQSHAASGIGSPHGMPDPS